VRKIQTSKQEQVINHLKKTYSNYKLTSHIDFGRLTEPKVFPYMNKARIYNETSKAILQAFEDIQLVYYRLPLSYRTKIIADGRFHRLFTDDIFPALREKEQKKKPIDDATKYQSYTIYHTMFAIGIEGLIRSMPTGFQNYLMDQIKPLMSLMMSITDFYRSTTGKKDIPYPYEIPGIIEYKF